MFDDWRSIVVFLFIALACGALFLNSEGFKEEIVARWQRRRDQRAARDAQRQQAATAQSQRDEPALPAIDQPRIAMARWVAYLNDHPQDYPHVLFEGATRSGKTSLARVLLHHRPGLVAAVGTKASDLWGPGYVYRSTERGPYLAALRAEIERRFNDDDKSPLTVVLDDYNTLADETEDAAAILVKVASDGAEQNIRLIVTVGGTTVDGLGIKGRGYVKNHFTTVRCFQTKQAALMVWDDQAWKAAPQMLDTSRVLDFARPLPAARWWVPIAIPARGGIEQAVLSNDASLRSVLGIVKPVPDNTADTDTDAIPATLNADAIRALIAVGWSKNKVAALIRKSKNTALSIIDEALEQTEQAA